MDSHTIQQIREALSFGFDALVRQQYVIGVQQIVGSVLLFIPAAVVARFGRLAWRAPDDEMEDDDRLLAIIVCSIVGSILAIFGVCLLMDGIGHFVNPVGYAVEGLLKRG